MEPRTMLPPPEIIVEIGAVGGSITLFGQKHVAGSWQFSRAVGDQTPTFLNAADGAGDSFEHTSGWVSSWDEAIDLLDEYPWALLGGLRVHPDFRDRVWAAVLKRLASQLEARVTRPKERWARVCGIQYQFGSNGNDQA